MMDSLVRTRINSSDSKVSTILDRLVKMVCNDDAQISARFLREHPEPSPGDVQDHLRYLVECEPGIFLERYGSYLANCEIDCFEEYEGVVTTRIETLTARKYEQDHRSHVLNVRERTVESTGEHVEEVRYYCQHLRSQSNSNSAVNNTVKNRRFAKMKILDDEGHYFSMESMQKRDPTLYDMYVGMPSVEKPSDQLSIPLSERIQMKQAAREHANRVTAQHSLVQYSCSEGETEHGAPEDNWEDARGDPESVRRPTIDLLLLLRQVAVFDRLMRERFLSGHDSDFVEYTKIDNDVSLDDFWDQQATADAQERYFESLE